MLNLYVKKRNKFKVLIITCCLISGIVIGKFNCRLELMVSVTSIEFYKNISIEKGG